MSHDVLKTGGKAQTNIAPLTQAANGANLPPDPGSWDILLRIGLFAVLLTVSPGTEIVRVVRDLLALVILLRVR